VTFEKKDKVMEIATSKEEEMMRDTSKPTV